MLTEIIAVVATFCMVLGYVPQIVKGYQTRSLADLSLLYLLIISSGIALWAFYAWLNGDSVFFVANIIMFLFASWLILLKFYLD